jgi:hypothetical protein
MRIANDKYAQRMHSLGVSSACARRQHTLIDIGVEFPRQNREPRIAMRLDQRRRTAKEQRQMIRIREPQRRVSTEVDYEAEPRKGAGSHNAQNAFRGENRRTRGDSEMDGTWRCTNHALITAEALRVD